MFMNLKELYSITHMGRRRQMMSYYWDETKAGLSRREIHAYGLHDYWETIRRNERALYKALRGRKRTSKRRPKPRHRY